MDNRTSPLISIIVPVYQAEAFLRECVESILCQTHQNLEVLLVNDGSTDAGGAICDEFALMDRRVRVIHRQNGGVSAARNTGLDNASGEYVGFVDSDDRIAPEMFEKLLEATRSTGREISVCGYLRHFMDGRTQERICPVIPADLPLPDAWYYLVSGKYFEGFSWNKLFNRRFFSGEDAIRFDPQLHFCEDLLLVVRCFARCDGIAYVPEALYHYQLQEKSAMHTYGPKRITELEARRRVLTMAGPLSQKAERTMREDYVEAAGNLLYTAVQAGDKTNYKYLQKESRRYFLAFLRSKEKPFKAKVRYMLIVFFPRFSSRIWQWMKRRYNVVWDK